MPSKRHNAVVAEFLTGGFEANRCKSSVLRWLKEVYPDEVADAGGPAEFGDLFSTELFGRFSCIPDAWRIVRYPNRHGDQATALIFAEVAITRPLDANQVVPYAEVWGAFDEWWAREFPVNVRLVTADRLGTVREVDLAAHYWKQLRNPADVVVFDNRLWPSPGVFLRDGLTALPPDEDPECDREMAA